VYPFLPRKKLAPTPALAARLSELRADLRENQTLFAQKLGVRQPVVAEWESGRKPISKEAMLRIAERAHGIGRADERDYWLRHAGVDLPSIDETVRSYKRTYSHVDGDRLVIPIRTGAISAGQPLSLSADEYEGSLALPLNRAADSGSFLAARVRGDSMAPRILDGDIAVIDARPHRPEENLGHVVAAANEDGGVTVKVLSKVGPNYVLVADNPSFEPRVQAIDVANRWSIVGRVVGWLGFPPPPKKRK